MKKLFMFIIMLYGFSFLVLAQESQEKNGLEQKLSAFIVDTVLDKDGKEVEVFKPATTAKSGQIIEYRYHAKNVSEGIIENFIPIIPIPTVTTYIDGSATGGELFLLEFSIDGGESFAAPPLIKTVKNEKGEDVQVEVEPAEYQSVRWKMLGGFQPKQEINLSFRVRVN